MRPLALVSLLLFPVLLHATLVPGSERQVTTPAPDVASFDQAAARIASDGEGFLAVWIDHALDGTGDVHGMRLSPEGARLDGEVLRIAVTDANENRVALAFGGGRYLVVWSTPTALQARMFGADGTMSDVFTIAEIASLATPQIAFNGSRFLVAWQTQSVYRGALMEADGQVVRTFDLASTAATPYTSLTAANGAFHLASGIVDFNGVPTGNGYPADVGLTPIDNEGTVGTRIVLAPADTPVFDLNATSNGTDVLVGWTTAIGIPFGTVRHVRATPEGKTNVIVVAADGMYLQDIVAEGSEFLLLYGSDTMKLMRRPASTAPLGIVSTPPTQTAILDSANNGERTLAIVRGAPRMGFEWGPAGGDLYVTRLDTMVSQPLVTTPRHQSGPDVAAAGDVRLAVWCEYIGSDRRLGMVAQRLDAQGNAIGAPIDLGVSVYHPEVPRVASNGNDWLVAWPDGARTIQGVRVAHDGSILDATPLTVATDVYSESDVAISWDGARYAVAHVRGQFLRGVQTRAFVSFVPTSGNAVSELALQSDTGGNVDATIASNGEVSLVVWRGGTNLRGALVSRGGTVMPIGFPAIYLTWSRPSVAWNHGTFLVAAPVRGPFGDEVQWSRVSASGVVTAPLSTFVKIDRESAQSTGAAALELEADGDGFLLFHYGLGSSVNVLAARIDSEGILQEAPTIVGSAVGGFPQSIGAAGNMVVYARKIGHPTREISRVFARTVSSVEGKPRRRAVSHGTR